MLMMLIMLSASMRIRLEVINLRSVMGVQLNGSLYHFLSLIENTLFDIGILTQNCQSLGINVILNLEAFFYNVLLHCFACACEISATFLSYVAKVNSLVDLSLHLVNEKSCLELNFIGIVLQEKISLGLSNHLLHK